MEKMFTSSKPLPKFSLWEKLKNKRAPLAFDIELTARCNNNCRHCYINLPAKDKKAAKKEISCEEIKRISAEAVSMGATWCLLTGGEPLLRKDFFEIYLALKKMGLLVSVFTNATLITERHIRLFKKYPARDIEVSVYGVTKKTYERITRKEGSFTEFTQGVNLLLDNKIKTRFKAVAMRSNLEEMPQISSFCRKITKDFFRFDPFLHLRFDGNKKRNEEIKSERLTADEIVKIEQDDTQRLNALRNSCDKLIIPQTAQAASNYLFSCRTGINNFYVNSTGFFQLCSSLVAKEYVYDLKNDNLKKAWNNFVPKVRNRRSSNKDFLEKCRKCPIINICLCCPAHSYLETNQMDTPIEYFCQIAHKRLEALKPEN